MQQVGFKPKDIQYVPCSGLTGVNLTENKEPRLKAWYNGETLLQAIGIDALPGPLCWSLFLLKRTVAFCISAH